MNIAAMNRAPSTADAETVSVFGECEHVVRESRLEDSPQKQEPTQGRSECRESRESLPGCQILGLSDLHIRRGMGWQKHSQDSRESRTASHLTTLPIVSETQPPLQQCPYATTEGGADTATTPTDPDVRRSRECEALSRMGRLGEAPHVASGASISEPKASQVTDE